MPVQTLPRTPYWPTALWVPLVAADRREATPNPWARPAEGEVGFPTLNTADVDVRVLFHRNAQARTIYLVVDETAAPLVGNYVLELDANTSTYDATAGVPVDVAALLTAWAAQILTDLGPAGGLALVVQSAVAVAFKNPDSGVLDAIQVTALASAADPAQGLPAGATYNTFTVGAAISAPQLANLHLIREVDSASLSVWTRNDAGLTTEVRANLNAGVAAHVAGWAEPWDVGVLPTGGYAERFYMPTQAAGFLHLYALATGDGPFVIAGAGAGLYGVVNQATAYLAPTQLP